MSSTVCRCGPHPGQIPAKFAPTNRSFDRGIRLTFGRNRGAHLSSRKDGVSDVSKKAGGGICQCQACGVGSGLKMTVSEMGQNKLVIYMKSPWLEQSATFLKHRQKRVEIENVVSAEPSARVFVQPRQVFRWSPKMAKVPPAKCIAGCLWGYLLMETAMEHVGGSWSSKRVAVSLVLLKEGGGASCISPGGDGGDTPTGTARGDILPVSGTRGRERASALPSSARVARRKPKAADLLVAIPAAGV